MLLGNRVAESLCRIRQPYHVYLSIDGGNEQAHDSNRGKDSFRRAVRGGALPSPSSWRKRVAARQPLSARSRGRRSYIRCGISEPSGAMRRLAASHPDRGKWVRSHLQRQPRSDAPLAGGRARPAAQWSLFLGRLQLIRVADGGRVAMHPHANCQSGGAPWQSPQ